ncbi:MAG: hypothetical protein AB7I24_18265 [Candidatus Nanopelagicales bacterium]
MSAPSSSSLRLLAGIRDETWRARAACLGAVEDFVDVDQATAPVLVRAYCRRCWVISHCAERAEVEAPYPFRVVMGGRVWQAGERP